MSECNKCKNNSEKGCGLFGDVKQPVALCAGKELTIMGWVNAVNNAELSGYMEQGALYRQIIKDLRSQKDKL